MLSTRNLRYGALLTAAFTFAACGSDDLTSPGTQDNHALAAQMTAALVATNEDSQPVRYQALQAAAAALTAGAPVTNGSLIVDGDTLAFDLTSITLAYDAGSGPFGRETYVVAWRPGNIDSLAVFYFVKGHLAALRNGPVFGGAMVAPLVGDGGGTVAKEYFPIDLRSMAFTDGETEWAGEPYSMSSGSIVYGAESGECSDVDPADYGFEGELLSCAQQGVSVDGLGQLFELPELDDAGPSVRLPGQFVGGVTGVFQAED